MLHSIALVVLLQVLIEMASNIALGFNNLNICAAHAENNFLISNVSGYSRKGCMTVVMGASGSGKSVLLQALSGRIQDLNMCGDVVMNGVCVDPKNLSNPIAFVPQVLF